MRGFSGRFVESVPVQYTLRLLDRAADHDYCLNCPCVNQAWNVGTFGVDHVLKATPSKTSVKWRKSGDLIPVIPLGQHSTSSSNKSQSGLKIATWLWLDSNPQPSILRFTVLSSMPLWLVLQWNLWWETARFKTTFSETLPWYVHVNVLLTVPLFRPLLLDFFFREGALKRVVPLYHDVCRWSFCLKFNLVWLQV